MTRLGEIEPRERAGAKTGRRYEYQYERAARRALTLLDHQQRHVCIYCDWHDDFVVEREGLDARYIFHQVKGRKSGLGAWSFVDFFGLARRTARPLPSSATFKRDAVVPLMLQHHKNFPTTCGGLAFVTNTGFEPPLEAFMSALQAAPSLAEMSADDRTAFEFIALAYLAGKKPLAPNLGILFKRIRGIVLFPDEPHLDEERFALAELIDLIDTYSEINLVHAQSKKIARGVIDKVRQKAHFDKTVIPASEEQLRREKGIVLAELLGVLSLSTAGYDALRQGTLPVDIKQLSRIQRYCERIGAQALMADVCAAKSDWDSWRTVARHTVTKLDFMALGSKAAEVVAQNYPLHRMIKEAKTIAEEFVVTTSPPLRASQVLGLMFSIVAQSESRELRA